MIGAALRFLFAPVGTLLQPLRSVDGALFVLLLFALTASAIGAAYAQFRVRLAYAELQRLHGERDRHLETRGQLLLERSTLASLARVDVQARETLGLIVPPLSSIRELEPAP